jgi:type III restriction enzyme
MLKEGWDVRNVTVICGLRAYAAKSNILPEQTLGRGLRRMYFGNDTVRETVSVLGTPAFMDFVESIQSEGVTFERVPMGGSTTRHDSLIVEVDSENEDKDVAGLDIPLPRLTRRYQREFKNLDALDPAAFGNPKLPLKPFTEEETREIVFKTMLDAEVHHTIILDGAGVADYRSVVAFFARQLLKDLRLVGGYEVLYPKVRDFMREHLFSPSPVNLEDPVVLRNLSEPDAGKTLYDAFKKAINALTVQETGTTRIEDRIRLRDMRPFRTDYRAHLTATKCLFNKIVGEPNSGGFELRFAAFLEDAPDVRAFAKNYLAVGFKLDYVKANGDLANYVPDFIVRDTGGTIWLVETKGREELDLPQKMARLKQWCADATDALADADEDIFPLAERPVGYAFVFVDQTSFEKHVPKTFAALTASFTEYKS